MGLLGRLFGSKEKDVPQVEDVDRMVRRVLELSPRLRLAQGHQVRLGAAIAKAAAYLRERVAAFPAPRDMRPASWSSDPYIRAFFAAADDIGPVLGRSVELRSFFEQQPGQPHAFVVLGMAMNERRTLGVAQEGGITRTDVAQSTLGFSDHQIRICEAADAGLRQAIVQRMIEQLAIEALARIGAASSRRDVLEQERALLATRVRLLTRQGTGMASVAGGETPGDAGETARLRGLLEENDRDLKSLGPRAGALDRQLDAVCEVFANVDKMIHVTGKRLRLSHMNVVLPEHGTHDGHALDLNSARVPGDPPRERAFALVRVSREDLPKAENLLDAAERML